MSTLILRRRKLGLGSCRGLVQQMQTPVQAIRNDTLERRGMPHGITQVIRWGCTSSVDCGNVLNTARAIHEVNNKRDFRMKLQDEGEDLVPLTIRDALNNGGRTVLMGNITYPCIVRPTHHHQGRRLWVCRNHAELRNATARCTEGWYASELINKTAEYRVFVVQGRVASVARKTPGNPNDIAWNVAQGGRFDNVRWDEWPLQAVRKSVEAFNLSSLDFGGVDVMVDDNNTSYIIEINSAPSLPMNEDGTPSYRQLCMAKCFDYIVRNSKDRIPLREGRGGYRKFIHPAVCERAE